MRCSGFLNQIHPLNAKTKVHILVYEKYSFGASIFFSSITIINVRLILIPEKSYKHIPWVKNHSSTLIMITGTWSYFFYFFL